MLQTYEKTLKKLIKLKKQQQKDLFSDQELSVIGNITFEDLEVLDYLAVIKLTAYTDNAPQMPDYSVKVLPKSLTYFPRLRQDNLRFWLPFSMSLSAIIISVAPLLYKKLPNPVPQNRPSSQEQKAPKPTIHHK